MNECMHRQNMNLMSKRQMEKKKKDKTDATKDSYRLNRIAWHTITGRNGP